MHLLQLAGVQVWPNLLPILALKPSTVTFLTSADHNQNYRRSLGNIQKACLALGVEFHLQTLSTQDGNPTTEECRHTLKNLTPDCINLTGGTKPMSIAAYDLAQHTGIGAFYLDTRRSFHPIETVCGLSSGFFDPDSWNLPGIVARITVPIALKAHGFPVPDHFEFPAGNWTAFSLQAAKIRMDPEADHEISSAIIQLRTQLMGTSSSMPRKGQLRKVLKIPISARPGSAWHRYLAAAGEEGIILAAAPATPSIQEFFLLTENPATTPSEQLGSLATKTFKLLEGIWFELAVLHHLQQKSTFSDICWSVEADHLQESTASSRGETDLVAFNTTEFSLHFISCKTSGPHSAALDHIQGLRRRSTKEGGAYAKAELWIYRPKSSKQRIDLENHCKEQNVALRIFTELSDQA